jgi:hypothetical protein
MMPSMPSKVPPSIFTGPLQLARVVAPFTEDDLEELQPNIPSPVVAVDHEQSQEKESDWQSTAVWGLSKSNAQLSFF